MRSVRATAIVAVAAVAVTAGVIVGTPAQTRAALTLPTVVPAMVTSALEQGPFDIAPKPDVRAMTFYSDALARTMPYSIYLPPDYATSTHRYPVLYMLHGMSGTNAEWQAYGIFDVADGMIRAKELRPMIIVLPQGDQAYWVDHALPTDQTAWGRYAAKDVVGAVDAHFRTIPDAPHRAVGGVSMGAHGAMQLAMNYPGVFSVVGAHSLVLRRYDTAPAFFGSVADWTKRDPMQLVYKTATQMKRLDLWIDIGKDDPWATLAEQFNGELNTLGIDHEWHEWSGDHSAAYWSGHLEEYLRFYDGALRNHLSAMPEDALHLS